MKARPSGRNPSGVSAGCGDRDFREDTRSGRRTPVGSQREGDFPRHYLGPPREQREPPPQGTTPAALVQPLAGCPLDRCISPRFPLQTKRRAGGPPVRRVRPAAPSVPPWPCSPASTSTPSSAPSVGCSAG